MSQITTLTPNVIKPIDTNICESYGSSSFQVILYGLGIALVIAVLGLIVGSMFGMEVMGVIIVVFGLIGFITNVYLVKRKFRIAAESCKAKYTTQQINIPLPAPVDTSFGIPMTSPQAWQAQPEVPQTQPAQPTTAQIVVPQQSPQIVVPQQSPQIVVPQQISQVGVPQQISQVGVPQQSPQKNYSNILANTNSTIRAQNVLNTLSPFISSSLMRT